MDIILLEYPETVSWLELEGYVGCLTRARRNGVLKKKTETDRVNALISRLLLLSEIESRTGIRQSKIEFTRGTFGKPYIKGSDLQFSLSHTRGAVCLAFSEDGEIGVDVERRDRAVRRELYGRVLCGEELSALENGGSFVRFWVQKEAFLKRLGLGISRDLRGVNTLTLPDTTAVGFGEYFIGISGKGVEKGTKNDKIEVKKLKISDVTDRFIKKL